MESLPGALRVRFSAMCLMVVKMVWGERRGHATFGAVEQSDGVPHAAIE
jgi:hypothetical protein